MEPTISKRLHISGLTPAISQQDLTQRLSTFGNVKSLDGLGLLDANGQPRRFAYATLEATPSKLSKCFNTLSGSVWKGTKLRVGEAKPDFRERIKRENEKAAAEAAEPPRKKPRWKYIPYHAVEAKDMTPITLERAKSKPSWVVTPLGRIYRPLRLRPPRPLSLPAAPTFSNVKGKGETLKIKKRRRRLELRARLRRIDMMKYGSIYLKGKFLDVDVLPEVSGGNKDYLAPMEYSEEEEDTSQESGDEDETKSGEKDLNEGLEAEEDGEWEDVAPVQSVVSVVSHPTSPPIRPPQQPTVQQSTSLAVDLDLEKHHSLNVLASIFGTPAGAIDEGDEDDWIGRESVGSDVDEADLISDHLPALDRPENGDVDFEVVPRENVKRKRQEHASGNEVLERTGSAMEVDEESSDELVEKEVVKGSPKPQKEPQQKGPPKLKDLFAPAEAEVFSLLGHLNLDDDLELDEDVPFPTTQDNVEISTISEQPISAPITTLEGQNHLQQTRHTPQITLDPSEPLFFPLALLSSHPSFASSSFPTNPNAKNRPKDLYETLKANGQDWRTAEFYRTQSEDEIRQRWEEQKGELTVGWKKRWREARRAGRKRGRGGAEDEAS